MRRLLGFALSFAVAGLGAASAPAADAPKPLLVFGAASLTESLQEIGKSFESKTGTAVTFSFGASSDLARQIAAGAPADVFFSADTAKMEGLEKGGFVRRQDRREFLSNRLAVVVPLASAAKVTAARDLLQFSKLALADPEAVPAGIYARHWLENAGLWKKIQPHVVPTLDVRAALAAVETEAAPAAVVYSTDARISKKVKPIFETRTDPPILYSAAAVANSANPAASGFVAFLQTPESLAVFQRAGFAAVASK
ncbi:MAG TPA: molybdate ABC transporter substrate-binding protein [Thermoanaerobaculia bacterium]|nr:molybdate ABC transporter substrate-binding protein [Thermoanaerobaculia bacterium]